PVKERHRSKRRNPEEADPEGGLNPKSPCVNRLQLWDRIPILTVGTGLPVRIGILTHSCSRITHGHIAGRYGILTRLPHSAPRAPAPDADASRRSRPVTRSPCPRV